MLGRALSPLRRFIPDLGEISIRERLRASAGAMVGLLVTGLVTRAALGTSEGLPLLIAPMGASAVLLFAVPSSPLAQPWSILGGNVLSALIGIASVRLIADPIAAASVACACAIGTMLLFRCLHPPSGAVALTAVLGGPAIQAAGFSFAVWPVGLNSVLLVAVALAFNNATGRPYPHFAQRPEPARPPSSAVIKSEAAVAAVLRQHDELIDVARDDLAALFEEVEEKLEHDRFHDRRCADVMQRDVAVVAAETALETVVERMNLERGMPALVVDGDGRFVGLVSQADLIRHLRPTRAGRRATKLFRRSIRFDLMPSRVRDVMSMPAIHATADLPLHDLLPAMLEGALELVPVLDQSSRLIGVVTQSDLLRALSSDRTPPAGRGS